MNEKIKDILIRAAKTFWQAALAYLLADTTLLQEALSGVRSGNRALPALLIGACAAGLSAVSNLVLGLKELKSDGN